MITPAKQQECVQRLLQRLNREKFYGKVVLSIDGGHLIYIRLEQSIRPEDLLVHDQECRVYEAPKGTKVS